MEPPQKVIYTGFFPVWTRTSLKTSLFYFGSLEDELLGLYFNVFLLMVGSQTEKM